MSPLSGKKISVVHIEDNADNRFLIQLLLEDRCELRSCASGQEGLEAIRERKPDVVLLDISLPEMDGRQVLKSIRSDPELEGLAVIALTAHAMSGDRERYLEMGFDEYLTKPILDDGVLLAALQQCAKLRGT